MAMIGPVQPKEHGWVSKNVPEFNSNWITWFNQAYTLLFSIQQSGTTAQRPTTNLWIGRRYYDQTLGKPCWIHSVNPPVWHDGSGAVV